MNWKFKALGQNAVARLPDKLSYETYYLIQRTVGDLRHERPLMRLRAGVAIVDRICRQGRAVAGRTFLEVGTGRRLNIPLALWLCGAAETITVDLNPYLKSALIRQDMAFFREHASEVTKLFGRYSEEPRFTDRLKRLTAWSGSVESLLDLIRVRYLAPANAAKLELASTSVDYHISFTVLEHIPATVLLDILVEGKRMLRPDGFFVHCVDFSDHFAQSDNSITTVNFLQFSEEEWDRWAGNRFMYHNRLRVDEFSALVEQAGLRVLSLDSQVDARARQVLDAGMLPLAPRFQGKAVEVNATASAWLVAAPGA